jgi:hypothetical protein
MQTRSGRLLGGTRLDVLIAIEGLRGLGLQMEEVPHDTTPAWTPEVLAEGSPNKHGPYMSEDRYAYWKYTNNVYVNYDHPCLQYVPSSAIRDCSRSDDVVYLEKRRFKRAMRRLGVRV